MPFPVVRSTIPSLRTINVHCWPAERDVFTNSLYCGGAAATAPPPLVAAADESYTGGSDDMVDKVGGFGVLNESVDQVEENSLCDRRI